MKEYADFVHGPLGLYGYFVFLADLFLKPEGRLALVLPATTLKIGTTQGLRDLVLRGYTIEFMVTTFQRAAFSENASFREILLIAKKTKSSNCSPANCLIVFLKKMPKNTQDAAQIAALLRNKRGALETDRIYDDEYIHCKSVTQANLKESASNLFKFIATFDWEMAKVWEKIEKRGSFGS